MDERAEGGFDGRSVEPEAGGDFAEGEGTVRAGVAADELEDGRRVRGEEGFGQTGGKFEMKSVAVAGRIFDAI